MTQEIGCERNFLFVEWTRREDYGKFCSVSFEK